MAVLAEGPSNFLDERDLEGLDDVERDQHGHVRLAEVNFGVVLKRAVEKELRTFGVKTTIVDKNIGYELRVQTRFPSIWNIRATWAIARRSFFWMAALRPWCRFKTAGSFRFRSVRL